MIKNYFKTSFRNLIKNKSYAFISIFGLAIGMAVCILLLLYIKHELSYDSFNKNADHIYRLCQPQHPFQAPQTAKLLADNIPEIKDYARILVRGKTIVQYKDKRYLEKENAFALADASLFRIFSFKFKQGDPEKALQPPFTVVISENLARKYFGNENPIAQVIKLDNELNVTITGVMEDMPQNSHFRYELIASLSDADKIFGSESMNNWGWQNFLVYFLMQDRFSQPAFEKKCSELIAKHKNSGPDSPAVKYSIQNLRDIHLYSSHLEGDIQPQNSITYVLIFSAIGFLILLIACFNYVNLLTANATTRAKEIAIRKVAGASRQDLARQFIGESFVVLFIALILALVFVAICLPVFNTLSGKILSFKTLMQIGTILEILAMLIITGFLAGSYPAFFLAKYQPAKTLKAGATTGRSKYNFRKILVGAQFTIVIVLICSALFMFNQIHFLQNKKLGFDRGYTLLAEVDHPADDVEKYNALKQALLKESVVKSVSMASRVPSDSLNNLGTLLPAGQTKPILLPFVHVHYDYFETLGITAAQGRLFSSKFKTDADEAIIINEAAVKKLELKGNPIGQSVACSWPKSNRKVIGVVDDFHFESLYEKIQPTVFVIDYRQCYQLMIKVNPSNAQNTINKLAAICKNFYPDGVFEFHFLDTKLESLYQKDKITFQLMGYFTILAIFIACMGLFGLGLIMMKSRTKEIGVRKVLGASIMQILILFAKDFTRWVLIANIIAWPVAFYAMNKWLQNFAYRIDMTIWPFLLSGLSALVIALLTVGYQGVKAALANPIESLRYE
ncbi:MAG: ABC transporter permease [Candidatus Aminicenantes bacterium]|nr:ABC transporter permease [Candidatus Aminicenantes bacterium]